MARARNVGATVHIDGLKELNRALTDIDPKLKAEVKQALAGAAQPVLADARSNAPFKRGRLRGSIRLYPRATGVAIGSPLVYAPVIEFAHKGRYSSLTKRHGAPPRVIYKAIDAHRDSTEEQVERALDEALQRIIPSPPRGA